MEKEKIQLVVMLVLATFFIIYSIHFSQSFPMHIDEWHHISEAIKLKNADYSGGTAGFRLGFHLFLYALSFLFNIILIYKFLPAIWAVVSVLVLFYVVYKKTGSFSIAIFSMVFLASLKSNVNIGGLWFFTPLTFSIPFIYLYIHFFSEGILHKNKKFLLISLSIMSVLIIINSLSVLFAIPFLLVYGIIHREYIKKEIKFFSLFLIIPFIGIIFCSSMMHLTFSQSIAYLIEALKFKQNWQNSAVNNSFTEIYSIIGYTLAIMGLISLLLYKRSKEYLIYLLWPAAILLEIFVYRSTGFSYLSPYQRNFYFFAISLPLLSAFGLNHLIQLTKFKKITKMFLIILIFSSAFINYYNIPNTLNPRGILSSNDLPVLTFLSNLPKQNVLTGLTISGVVYPISGKNSVITYFQGDPRDSTTFFDQTIDCRKKQEIIDYYDIDYVMSRKTINCGWTLLYDKDTYKVYETNEA